MRIRHTTRLIWAAMVVMALAATANATSMAIWDDGAGDGDWFNPINWSDDVLPVAEDFVFLTDATFHADGAVVNDLDGRLQIVNPQAALEDLTVGMAGGGLTDISLADGWLSTGTATIGEFEGSGGVLNVQSDPASGCVWTVDRQLTVGASGTGFLDLRARTESPAAAVGLFFRSQGSVVVHGDAMICDADLTVGMYGDGLLTIEAGGSVITPISTIGFGEGSTGTVSVGPAGEWTVDDALIIGQSGTGSLAIAGSDSAVTSAVAVIGGKWDLMDPGSGTVTVDDNGRWTNSGDLYVGESGTGEVAISGAGAMTFADGYLGYGPDAAGTVTLIDEGTSFSGTNLFVGGYGQGQLTVGASSDVAVTGRLYLGYRSGGDGTCTMAGGRLDVGELYIGGDAVLGDPGSPPIARRDGMLDIAEIDSWVYVSRRLAIGPCGSVAAVPASGIGLHSGAAWENTATDPAALDGLMNVNLHCIAGTGVTTLEVAAADEGAGVEGLDLTGRFTLSQIYVGGGVVTLVNESDNQPDSDGPEALYVDGLVLAEGSTLDLNGLNLYYRTFFHDLGTVVSNGGSIQPVYLAGDVDGDGDVDLGDFIPIKQNFGMAAGATRADGDLNGDGAVDLDDFVILKSNFGQ